MPHPPTRVVLVFVGLFACLSSAAPALSAGPPAPKEAAARLDIYGDPLPDGATARLGTVRFSGTGQLDDVNFSPDGKVLAAANDGVLSLWDARTGKEIRRFGERQGSGCFQKGFAFSSDGKLLAEAGSLYVNIWDVKAGKLLVSLKGEYRSCSMAFSPDGKTLAASGQRSVQIKGLFTNVNNAALWEVATGKELHDLGEADSLVAYSPTGDVVASCRGASISLWNPVTGKRLLKIDTGQKNLFAMTFAPDGKILAAVGTDRKIVFWDPETGNKIRSLTGHDDAVTFLRFSSDGRTLTSRSGSATVLWDAKSGEQIRTVKLPASRGERAADLSPDGKTFATTIGPHARLWDVTTGKEKPTGPVAACSAIVFSPDGGTLFTGGYAYTGAHRFAMQTWETASGKLLREWDAELTVMEMALSPDGKSLASAGWSMKNYKAGVRIWDAATGRSLAHTEEAFSDVKQLTWARDGKTVSLHNDDGLFIIDAEAGKMSRPAGQTISARKDTDKMSHAVGQRNGRREEAGFAVELTNDSRPLRLWEVATGREVALSPPFPGPIRATAFSPDGSLLAVGGVDGAVCLVETASGKRAKQFQGRKEWVDVLTFSPDGSTLASAGGDSTVLLWEVSKVGAQVPSVLSIKKIEDLLNNLDSEDAAQAFAARQILTAAPKQSVPLLLARLKSLPPGPSPERLARLIAGLDADDFQAREGASAELAKLGTSAEAALRTAMNGDPSAEAGHRLDDLLKKLTNAEQTHRIRLSRAIAVLENAKAPESRQALEELAKGPAEAPTTIAAKAAVARLARFPSAP
ncbi:MAG TPA: hypothetical protein DDY78_09780 [Planctomycetales bacterium]|nr:hypothetical protein [Planctomycetales bacterium]